MNCGNHKANVVKLIELNPEWMMDEMKINENEVNKQLARLISANPSINQTNEFRFHFR